jgi:hypothetical protein
MLQKQKPRHRKTVLSSSPGKDVFYNLENNDGRRAQIRPTMFVSARRLQEQSHKQIKMSWVRVPVKAFSVPRKIIMVEEHRKD